MQYPDSKLPTAETTIFARMSHLAAQYQAINLAQGFPDFGVDKKLIDLTYQRMLEGHNQYAPMPGVKILRDKISAISKHFYGYEADPDSEITVTCGATEAVYNAITALVKPGDEVIIFEPAFDSYISAIELCGGKPVYIQMHWPHYSIDWQEVHDKITPKTKLLILNNPHNPSGQTLNIHDIHELQRIVNGNHIYLISDEVYEHMVFDKCKHESILAYADLRYKSFVISSFGKNFHATGWRIGYCIAPEYLTKEFRKVHQYVTFSAHTATQYAIADYLSDVRMLGDLNTLLEKRRDYFYQGIKNSAFEIYPSKGSYFQLASFKNISTKSDIEFSEWLVKEKKLTVIPISPFYHNQKDEQVIRFCFAKKDETLDAAIKIINSI